MTDPDTTSGGAGEGRELYDAQTELALAGKQLTERIRRVETQVARIRAAQLRLLDSRLAVVEQRLEAAHRDRAPQQRDVTGRDGSD